MKKKNEYKYMFHQKKLEKGENEVMMG